MSLKPGLKYTVPAKRNRLPTIEQMQACCFSPLCEVWIERLTVVQPCFPPICGALPAPAYDITVIVAEGASAFTLSRARTTAWGLCGVCLFVETVLVLGTAGLVCSRNLADVLRENH